MTSPSLYIGNPAVELHGFEPGINYGAYFRLGARGGAVGKPLGIRVGDRRIPWVVIKRLAKLGHIEIVLGMWAVVPLLFRCASKHCPGFEYKASIHPHPSEVCHE